MKNEITAKRLQIALSDNNMKAQELANKSGVGKASISQYVNGSHAPSNINAGKMAKVLGVNPVWLMGYDVPMKSVISDSNGAIIEAQLKADGWYVNRDAAEYAEFLRTSPEHRVIFDAAKNVKKEDLEKVVAMIRLMSEGK